MPFTEAPAAARAAEPTAVPQFTRNRTFDVQHIRLNLRFDEPKRAIYGEAAITLRPMVPLSHVELDAAELSVTRVKLAAGRTLPFHLGAEKLHVDLDRTYRPSDEITLSITYSCTPRKGVFFIQPDKAYPKKPFQIWSQGESEDNRFWFPCYDFPNDKATTEVLLTVRERCFGLSNGHLVGVSHDRKAKTKTWHWRQDVPHAIYLVAIVVGEFEEVQDSWDGIPISYYVPKGRSKLARTTFGRTPEIMKFFSEKIGLRYPWPKYIQVVISDFMWGGMENTTITTINERALTDQEHLLEADSDGLVAHELAHQWWGDLVTTKNWQHIWLNEGFATYFDALFREHHRGRDEMLMQLFDNARSYFKEAGEKQRRAIVTNVYTDPEDMFDRHSYEKGSIVLHMLRYVLGDDCFWKAIGHYAHKHAAKSVETTDFKTAIEESTGHSLDWFFDQWLHKPGHPEFAVKWSWDGSGKSVTVNVQQTQSTTDGTPVYRMPVDLQIATPEGRQNYRVHVSHPEEQFHFTAATRPLSVIFDPESWILKTLKAEKSREEWLYDLRNTPGIAGRLRACDALGKFSDDEKVLEALHLALTRDTFWGVRSAAAYALSKVRNEANSMAILDGFRDADSRVRRATADALGEFKDGVVGDRLAAQAAKERNDYVVADCLRSMGKSGSKRSFATLLKYLRRESHNECIRVAVFEGLTELRDTKAIAVARKHLEYGHPSKVRSAAASTLAKLHEIAGAGQEQIRKDLIALCTDRDHATRRG
ncbi:MAG: HEAT repeat domain-containing protein, partial [Planctomycetes bacterium]|nr:HEAT repeat domain-containing protein [Planctomycetota bacterium]